MDTTNRWKCHKALTLLGSVLLIVPGSIDWQWGAMSVYVFSFILSRHPSDTSVEVPWILSLFTISWIVTLILGGTVSNIIKRRWLVLVSVIFQDVTFFMCHFAIQHSLALLNLTLSVLVGIAQGFLYGNGIHIVISTANKDEGFLSSVLLIAPPLGGLISSQVSTWYVNTQNEAPNLTLGSTMYFTQKHIIEKVPSMFLVMGGFSFFSHSVGLILLQGNPDMRFITSSCSQLSELMPLTESVCHMKNDIQTKPKEETPIENSNNTPCSNANGGDYTPREMLKTFTFYVVWISTFMSEIPYILLLNYYKLYGQIWIRDDHFLTYLGTTYMLIISVSRVPWGMAMDKVQCQLCLIGLISSLILIQSWYYFTAMVGRWTYFLITCFYGFVSGASYSCFCAAGAMLFGKKHVSTNTGLLLTSALAVNLCAPYVIDVVLANLGWFTLFAGAAGLNIISLGLVCCTTFVQRR